MFSLEKKEPPAKCMETLYPKSGKQTQVVCFPKEHLKPCDPRCRRETRTHMFMGRQCAVQSWCRLIGLSDSLPRSKPTGEPQTKPDIRLFVINTVLFRTLTNVCLLLPPSPSSPPSASCFSSCFLCSRCSWHLLELPVDLWPPDELYAQKLKYKAISEELDHALNDMTSM